MSEAIIQIRELTKRFPLPRRWTDIVRRPAQFQWATALDGVDLDVSAGEILAIIGPNGAGKTTLLKILSTLLLPTAGRAEVRGFDVVKSPEAVRHSVGWCLDTERSFYHRLTGLENLSFFAALNNINSGNAPRRVREVVEVVGLGDVAQKPFRMYSRGMQQKLGLARALLSDPPILMLDEATKGLDPAAAQDFWNFMRGELIGRMGKTILIVTHNLQEARFCCDRVAFMHKGGVSATGPWRDVEHHVRAHGFGQEIFHDE